MDERYVSLVIKRLRHTSVSSRTLYFTPALSGSVRKPGRALNYKTMSKFADNIAEAVKDRLLENSADVSNPVVWQVTKHTSSAFTGGTANAHGDHDGTGDPYTIFSVTGDVIIKAVWGICNTSLVGAGTLEVGVTGNTAKLIAQIADTTTLDDGDVWTDAGTEAGVDVQGAGVLAFINDGADIIETAGTANITAGQIDYYCMWAPAEPGASVVSAAAVA